MEIGLFVERNHEAVEPAGGANARQLSDKIPAPSLLKIEYSLREMFSMRPGSHVLIVSLDGL